MKTVRLRRKAAILVCGKCLKRHADGKALRRDLKTQAKAAGAAVVRTSCLGICPRDAVVMASRTSFANGTAVLVKNGDMVVEALHALGVTV